MLDLHLVGYACGLGDGDPSLGLGPIIIEGCLAEHAKFDYKWLSNIYPCDDQLGINTIRTLNHATHKLGLNIQNILTADSRFAVIGGDHTAALGAWLGAQQALGKSKIGIIWLDGRLRTCSYPNATANKLATTVGRAILGHSDCKLNGQFNSELMLTPKQLTFVGAHTYTEAEHQFLQDLNADILLASTIGKNNFSQTLRQVIRKLSDQYDYLGVSIDLSVVADESIDPPTTALDYTELGEALHSQLSNNPKFIGSVICGYDPNHDSEQQTAKQVCGLLNSLFE